MFNMPNAIHWGYEDRNLTGSDLIKQDDSTQELIYGGPALQQNSQSQESAQGVYQGGAVEIVEA